MQTRQKLLEFIAVFGACVLLSAAFTAPWRPNSISIPTAYQGSGEFFAKLDAGMWTYMLAWGAKHPAKFYDAPILQPVNDPLVANDPRLTEGLWSIPLFRMLPPVLAWGVFLWLALALTATGCYYAGKLFTRSRWGGAALAVLFAFGMFRANHVCHIEGIFVPFLALAFAAMVRFLEAPGRLLMAGFAVAFTAAVIEYSYIAVPLGLIMPLAFAWGVWRRKIPLRLGFLPLLVAGVLIALIMFPVAMKYSAFNQSFGVKRHIMHVDACSADLFAWITGPGGRILPPFGGLIGRNFVDPQLFPGFVLVSLGLAGMCMLWRKSPEMVVIGISAFVLSFGTMRFLFWQMGLSHFEVRTPYELLYEWLLPFKAIRAPARFGVLTHLVLAFAGTMVVVKMISRRNGKMLAVALMVFSFLEARAGIHAVPVMPERVNDPAYGWLAGQPGDFAVLEAPMGLHMVRSQHSGEAEAMLMALVHGRRTPNGTLAATMPWHESIAVNTANPAHGEAKRLMQALGIRYVAAKDAETAGKYAAAGYKSAYGAAPGVRIFEVENAMTLPSGPGEVAKRLEGDPFYVDSHSGGETASAKLRGPARLVLRKGYRFEMPVTVHNTGQNAWAGAGYIYGRGEGGDVFAGVRRWVRVDPGLEDIARGPRGEPLGASGYLPSNLLPDESTEMVVTGIAPVMPGHYVAELDLGVRGLGWVSPPDKAPVKVDVTVE